MTSRSALSFFLAVQREVSSLLATVDETVEIDILSYVPFEYKTEANNEGRARTQTSETFSGTVYSSDNNEVMTTSGALAINNDGFKLESKPFDIASKKEVVTLTTDILPNRGQGLTANFGLTISDKA
ncbi:unnamed protein product [Rotaria socialis]|uniref:Uncharacterized protein n=1 Tax=Rotaria socialis TaxID=392032 RepID=A0A817UR46_9BILA|nr:unnamed protein product [Rotaria socialis]CAF3333333.1 unnamed protein product [Rotaria socialis]CAF3333983.1 unnamed protein product [Rotaria socialis]CAF3461359.1 unnamed protein product [Rotaria socialis]CAF4511930.1 unnamed protein product [Rotaria socialis]